MTYQIRELRQKRSGLVQQARAILDGAGERDLTVEENNRYDRLMEDANKLYKRIEQEERQLSAELDLDQPAGSGPVHTLVQPGPGEVRQRPGEDTRHFDRYLREGRSHLDEREFRALQADLDVSGGFITAPQRFINQLIKAVDDIVYIRQWGTPNPVMEAQSLGVPTLENDPADADWTTELATGSEDSTMDFGKRELYPHPLAKRIKVSRKLLRLTPNAEDLVRNRLGYKFQITWEKAGMTGSGANQPLGVFTASSLGISTSRDVSTGNDQTSIKFDGLYEAKYTLKPQYWNRARWLFHRDGQKQIAKLKDGEGRYLWTESVRVGEPDRLLGFPAFMSEYAPNTFTSGQYVGILGDFSFYWYADALMFELQRLDELYAESNQVGLIGRWESDGMPVLEEAFVRVKLA